MRYRSIPWLYYDHPLPWVSLVIGAIGIIAFLIWLAPDAAKYIIAAVVAAFAVWIAAVTIRFW